MAWPARSRFSLLNSRFQDFLFASIGNDEKGMPLSVASAMARLDVDPWTEAGRLAELPRVKAVEALASMISRIPLGNCEATLALDIADRLVALLPASSASSWIAPSRLSRPSIEVARQIGLAGLPCPDRCGGLQRRIGSDDIRRCVWRTRRHSHDDTVSGFGCLKPHPTE